MHSAHQSLLLWACRKMAADGFRVIAKDGAIPWGGPWNSVPAPPQIKHLRPDACGVHLATGHFALGEAKTLEDINTKHTREQLRVFGQLSHRNDYAKCRLYLSVPRSGVIILDYVLGQVGLLGTAHIIRLHIPDCLVTGAQHDCT